MKQINSIRFKWNPKCFHFNQKWFLALLLKLVWMKVFNFGNINLSWKISIPSSRKTKHFFSIIFLLSYLSSFLSHNSHVLLYLHGIDLCIKYLDMFYNLWTFIFEGKQESNNQVVLIIINMDHSSLYNQKNN